MKFNPSNTDHIGIEFKVWAPHLTRVTKKLFLLGSLKELGAWDVDKAIQAYPTTDMHTWNVEVSVPAMSQFEWAWLTTNLNRTGVDWEKTTKRSRTVDCFSGTLHTIYGDGEEVFLQTATCLEVTTYMRVEEGLTMVLTGSTPSTGEWDLHFAKQATEFPQRSGYWKVHVTFDALTNLEFKWAVVKEKDHGVLYVQEKLPHSIFGRKSWLRAVAPWNTSLVIVVDTSLLCDLPDTMLGRTEIIVKERKRRGQEIKSWLVKAESGKGTPVRSPRPPPSPVERLTSTAPLSVQIQPTRISLPVTPSLASSVTSLTHVPSVQRTLDLDEHVRQRQDSLSKLERLTQQLSKVYTEENTVYAIKGMGQTELATDKLNSDLFMSTSEGIARAYGETAEMTSLHLLPSSASSKHRQKYPLLGYDHHEKVARQPGERSLTRLLKSEEMPKLQEGEALSQVRGFSVSEDNNEEEGLVSGATQEVMPLCVTSQTVADTVPSDTGFTELSSWMSSIKTDVTASESALSSSHTMTCLLGADANNVSDGEESRSDHMTLPSRRLDTFVDGMTNYWETQQHDLSPPWLNKSQAGIQGGSGDFMVDCLDAMEEDYVHLEWLASRLEEEINYEMLQFGTCMDSVPQIPVEDAFLFRHEKIPSVQDFRNDHAKWSPSSPPKASPKIRSPLSFTLDKDDDSSREPSEQDLLSESESHAFEDEETIEKRSIARALEAQWGASYYRASEGQSVKNILSVNLPSWKNGTEKCPSYPVSVGLQGTMHSEWKRDKLTYYSFSELSDMLLPEADAVDHRAMAREAERLWGEGLTRKMQASHEGDSPVTILSNSNRAQPRVTA